MNTNDVLCELWRDTTKRVKGLERRSFVQSCALIGTVYILRKVSKKAKILESELEELKKEG